MRLLLITSLLFFLIPSWGQDALDQYTTDSLTIRSIYNKALLEGESYDNLEHLCKEIGHRITGSAASLEAVEWSYELMKNYGFSKVYKQEVMATHWERGSVEKALWNGIALDILALGGSVGTNGVLEAEVVAVDGIEDLTRFKSSELEGKIVLFNKGFDKSKINTFEAYGGCVGQRFWGASKAAELGAVGVMVRSLTTLTDHFPHTGSMGYSDDVKKIPAVAISTAHADLLQSELTDGNVVQVTLQLNCASFPDIKTYNVIGEITGSDFPNEVIVVGAHMDSWDVGEGAHDDGAGIVQCMEVLRLFKDLGIQPKHTLRAVLYMNEENGNKGGKTYASWVMENKENHVAAIESDRGGFTPRGFAIDGNAQHVAKVRSWSLLLKPYGLHYFESGFAGVDIGPLKMTRNVFSDNLVMLGLVPDPQRYFDYHHTADDIFENVNQRELELGGASMAAMVYLIDKYWNSLQ